MKKTKIICTVGPSTDNLELLTKMIEAGMDIARFNFSHGTHEDHQVRIDLVREASAKANKPVALLADTKGPEMRLGIFKDGSVTLVDGDKFCLTTEEIEGTKEISQVNYLGLPNEVKPGDTILLSDGLLALEVEKIDGPKIYTKVIHGGVLSSRKRVACPGIELQLPFLSEQDEKDLLFAIKNNMEYVAASFVQKAEDVMSIRKVLESHGSKMGIIPKIENAAGVRNIQEIIEVSEGIMVARGDLGVEMPAESIPLAQKEIIKECNLAGKPVITATQMLESMVNSYRATRAETSDVANAIFDGTDNIMLSGETASGKYPLEAVRTMATIAQTTEGALNYKEIFESKGIRNRAGSTEAISHACVQVAEEINADAILTITESGETARMIAKYRPSCKVIAVTRVPEKVKAMQLFWGVVPILGPYSKNTDEMIDLSIKAAVGKELCKQGDTIIVTAGVPIGVPGSTNLIKVVTLGKNLITGMGIGKKPITGKACVCLTQEDFETKFKEGMILVVDVLNDEAVKYATKASAIVAEEGGLTSSVAIVGVNFGIPVIVGASNATIAIPDGSDITVDTVAGIVYEGIINIQ